MPRIVNVDLTARGDWEVELPDQQTRVRCDTLEAAKRRAYRSAKSRHPCEIVVRDAYHRVLHRELIDGDVATPTPSAPRGREPLAIGRSRSLPPRRAGGRR